VTVLTDSLCERIGKWVTCPILKDGRSLVSFQLEHLTKTAKLLGVSRATVSKVTFGIHESWEHIISEEETLAKIYTDRKRSSYIKMDCFEKSHNYCSTGELQEN
jgi:hypothetical protein